MGLDIVEMFMAFEEKFDISIPDADVTELTTPRKVSDYIMTKVADRGMSREQVAAIVRQVIEETTATDNFSDDDHFVYDMNLD
jgi:acyl carrier protein